MATKQLLTLQEVSELLRIPIRTLYNWRSRAGFPGIRLGGLVRVDPDDLEAWIAAQRER